MPEHSALWLRSKRGPFEVGLAQTEEPGEGEILVRSHAIAVNPFERLIQSVGDIITPWIRYPAVLGSDVAGEVLAVGRGVTRFRVGDRVVGFAAGSEKGHRNAEGAFQSRVILAARLASPLPNGLSYEAASVLPLGVMTAAAALFQHDMLALQPPTSSAAQIGQTLVVWGGSTSVGCNAIQLAIAAGYDVIATASPHNFSYLKKLGARAVFDRRDPDVVGAVVSDLRGRETCGAIAIGVGSVRACTDILKASVGKRFVAMATPPASFDDVPPGKGRLRALLPVLTRIVIGNIDQAVRARVGGVQMKFIWGGAPADNELGPLVFESFLPAALASGRYIAAPEAETVGNGLESLPAALERQRVGVTARKLVVCL